MKLFCALDVPLRHELYLSNSTEVKYLMPVQVKV